MDKDTLFSSFGKYIAPINIVKLQQRVEEIKQDKYTKKLTTKAYLLLFLYAQLRQKESLHAISIDLLEETFQREVGFTSISPAQLSRKNNQVDPELLAEIFMDLVCQIHTASASCQDKKTYKIIDSTTVSLCLSKYKWASFRQSKAGIKIHLRLVFANQQDVYPEKVVITSAKSNDRTQMDVLIDEKGAMYVFDRGYVDYQKFDDYCDQGVFFASRLKKNADIRQLYSFRVKENSPILD